MSAFIHDPEHIAAILGGAIALTPINEALALDFAGRLAEANVASVNRRYGEATTATYPTAEMVKRWTDSPLSSASVKRAIDSLGYQSCDIRTWDDSAECAFLEMLKELLPPDFSDAVFGAWQIKAPPA